MKKRLEISMVPGSEKNRELIRKKICRQANVKSGDLNGFLIEKRSLDARCRPAVYRLRIDAYINEPLPEPDSYLDRLPHVDNGDPVLVAGCGPAGIFASLQLIEMGLRPVVVEKGRDVASRRADIAMIEKKMRIDPGSNYCFGEGGAGAFSDGKLYTRSKKKGSVHKVVEILVEAGADRDILVDARPHIGSDRLPAVVSRLRKKIEECGGTVHFESEITDIIVDRGKFNGLVSVGAGELPGRALILATGHSARDIYMMLLGKGVLLEKKGFAAGIRVEHPQRIIDDIQYGIRRDEDRLPPADYRLSASVGDTGVYSFCMCPGGIIVPASSGPGEIVLNGMSGSSRDSGYANSGIVVGISPSFITGGPREALEFQKTMEVSAFAAAGGSIKAPAQRLTDFLSGKVSSDLPDCSYGPGAVSSDLRAIMPDEITDKLIRGLSLFSEKMKGFLTQEAVLLAPETRTSSPVRILRDRASFMHPQVSGLFPAGEGSGYSGGIVSSAVDGMIAAEAAAEFMR